MPRKLSSRLSPRTCGYRSFSLVELLVVMAIIAILVGLTVGAGGGVIQHALRGRAQAEIQALGTKLEDYKSDNGAFPSTGAIALYTNLYSANDGSMAGGLYQQGSQILYMALSGKTNYLDQGGAGVKSYMSFKTSQVGNASTAANSPFSASTTTYVKDPWGFSYGYSTGTGDNGATTNYPYNGNYSYDMWSTARGLVGPPSTVNTNSWLQNWQQ